MNLFIKDIGITPKLMLVDCDFKLIGGQIADILKIPDQPTKIESNDTVLSGAPDQRQSQNGIVERVWQTLITMARNW